MRYTSKDREREEGGTLLPPPSPGDVRRVKEEVEKGREKAERGDRKKGRS